MKKSLTFLLIILAVLMQENISFAQNLERKDVSEKYKWNNSILYKSAADWQADRDAISKQIDKLETYQGKLSESADNFYGALRLFFDIYKSYYKLADYAGRSFLPKRKNWLNSNSLSMIFYVYVNIL